MQPIMPPASHGLWGATASPAPKTQALKQNITVDIAVIGAGFTGLSTALHLVSCADPAVAVLEASDIGFGASGRNAGMVNAGAWLEPDELPKRLGQDYGNRLLTLLGEGPDLVYDLIRRYGIECDAAQNGNLHCAVGAKGLASITERARQWRSHGVEVELLSAQRTAQLVGSEAYTGALLDPRTGTIQPLSYVRGLAAAAQSKGASIFTQTAVVNAKYENQLWSLSTSTGHVVKARQVVVATNTTQGPGPDAWPELQRDLLRLPYFNVATEPLSASSLERILPQGRGAWDTKTIMSSYRLDASGRLVYGSVGALGPSERYAHVEWVRRSITRLFPELRGVQIQYQWHGWIDTTANNLPHLHELAPNAWALSGYNGRGIAPGTILGRDLAKMLLGILKPQEMPLPVTGITPIGFKSLRETFYKKGAVIGHALSNRL